MANDIIERYSKFLIKQYYEKPKARQTVEFFLYELQQVADVSRDLINWLDVDTTTGEWLDIIGRIVQLPRRVPNVVVKNYFGFSDNENAGSFGDLFVVIDNGAPFYDANSSQYGEYELDDETYRRLLKVKIAQNNVACFMDSDERVSIQDVIEQAFDGDAYVIDNQDMTLTLFASPSIGKQELRLISELGLMPKPMAVRYIEVIQAVPTQTFGFSDNLNAKGFGDLSDPILNQNGGYFAEIFIYE